MDLKIYPGTQYETVPFNFRFKDGKESFSFLVPTCEHHVVEFLLRRPKRDNKADLKRWAIDWISRRWDERHCTGFAMRTINGRIEVRLEFSTPWYFAQLEEELRSKYAGQGADSHPTRCGEGP